MAAAVRFCAWLVFGMAFACFSISAQADVIEISPGGVQTVYNAPAVFTADGVQPILQLRTRSRVRHSTAAVARVTVSNANTLALLSAAADRYAIRHDLLTSVAWRESRLNNDAVSSAGAVGIMQLMKNTARDLGVNRYDVSENIFGGAAYLKQMLDRYSGNEALALAAYNAGPGAVDRYGGIPRFTETQQYVSAILGSMHSIQGPFSFVTFIDR